MAHGYDFIAFDIEIAKSLGDNPDDWMEHWPFGISCAMAAWRDRPGNEICYKTWKSFDEEDAMDVEQCQEMVQWLDDSQRNGYKIATTNGAGFDFKVVAHESQMHETCVKLTMNHLDFLFMMLAKEGYPIGLDAMCIGMGVEGKLHEVVLGTPDEVTNAMKGVNDYLYNLVQMNSRYRDEKIVLTDMSGAIAPDLWRLGFRDPVLAYLKEDVRSQLEVAEEIQLARQIEWKTKSGKISSRFMPVKTVMECLQQPVPDTSWMTGAPMLTRESVLAWTKGQTK